MAGTVPKLSQKEYLKKYLSGGSEEKKKKKKKKVKTPGILPRTKIIDDDFDISKLKPIDDTALDLFGTNEEAPVVVGIVDERPVEVQALDQYKHSQRWKVLSNPDTDEIKVSSVSEENASRDDSPSAHDMIAKETPNTLSKSTSSLGGKYDGESEVSSPSRRHTHDLDSSPPRRKSSNIPDLSPPRKRHDEKHISRNSPSRERKHYDDVDISPLRRKHSMNKDSSPPRRNSSNVIDLSPPRKKQDKKNCSSFQDREYSNVLDISPPRRKHADSSPPRRKSSYIADSSPQRKSQGQHLSKVKTFSTQDQKRNNDFDLCPPRRKYPHDGNILTSQRKPLNSTNPSPRKKQTGDTEFSPPRKKVVSDIPDSQSKRKQRSEDDFSSCRRYRTSSSKRSQDSDLSPTRQKQGHDSDTSPPRKRREDFRDMSPPRKSRFSEDVHHKREKYDKSLVREHKRNNTLFGRSSDLDPRSPCISPSRIKQEVLDDSPPRQSRNSPFSSKYTDRSSSYSNRESNHNLSPQSAKRSGHSSSHNRISSKIEERWESASNSKKIDQTLDGKVAGLQDASRLKDELQQLRSRENEAFAKMDVSVSGRGAAAVQRDRATGMKRNFELERAIQEEKEENENRKKEKYDKWGKGVKQTEAQRKRLAADLYEMSKPLARHADDKDLEKHYRDQEREGDPMLEYLRSKKRDDSSQPAKPVYQGSFPPNRYNIRPGYRWDGRDRSNGYEQKLFESMNAKKAVEEEAYKWSTSDM